MVDELEELGFDVIGKNFTTWKDKMVRLLAKDIEDGKAFLYDDGKTGIEEFEQYELNITPGGRITYSAPSGDHDDIVSAKMLQHWGLVNEGVPDAVMISGVDVSSIRDAEVSHPDDDEMPEDDDWSDILDEDDRDTGIPVVTRVDPRSAQDMMNDPACWG